jgi:hypothetical protein
MAEQEQARDEAPSMEDSINAAIESSAERVVASPLEPKVEVLTGKEPTPAKDALGRFTAKHKDDASPAVAASPVDAAATPATPAPDAPVTPPTTPAPEVDAAPSSWKDGVKTKWAELDPEVKAEIMRRERDISVGMQRAAETRKFGDSMYQEVAPYMELLKSEGATPQDAVRILLETAHTLRHGSPETKKALMLSMMEQYGIDFRQPFNPEVARLQWEVDSRRHNDVRAQAQQGVSQELAAKSEIEQFAAQPGHEHLDTLRPHMAALLQSGAATDLAAAYEQAAWANPQVRAQLLQKQDLEKQAALSKNRNAAASVRGSPGGVATSGISNPSNLRATLEEAFGGGRL